MDNNCSIIIIVCIIALIFLFNKRGRVNNLEGFKEFNGYKRYGGYQDTEPVYWPLDYKYGRTNTGYEINSIFSAHPRKLVCSHPLDERMQHLRLSDSGGVMYSSYNPPTDTKKCHKVSCPPLVNGTTPLKLDHYDPYPERRDKTTCWKC